MQTKNSPKDENDQNLENFLNHLEKTISPTFLTYFPNTSPLILLYTVGRRFPESFEQLLLAYHSIFLLSLPHNLRLKEACRIFEIYFLLVGPNEAWKEEATDKLVDLIEKRSLSNETLEFLLTPAVTSMKRKKKDFDSPQHRNCVEFICFLLNSKSFGVQIVEVEDNTRAKCNCVNGQNMVDWILRTLVLDIENQNVVPIVEYFLSSNIIRFAPTVKIPETITLAAIKQSYFQLTYKPHHSNEPPFNFFRNSGRIFLLCDNSIEACLLSSTYWKQEFIEFLIAEKSVENILFFDEVEGYRVDPTPTRAIEIFSKYISGASRLEINIPGSVRKGISLIIRGLLNRGYMYTKGFKEVKKNDDISAEANLNYLPNSEPRDSILPPTEVNDKVTPEKRTKKLKNVGRSCSSSTTQFKIHKIHNASSSPTISNRGQISSNNKVSKSPFEGQGEEEETSMPTDMFDLAQKSIMKTLTEDSFARFKKMTTNFDIGNNIEKWFLLQSKKSKLFLVFFDHQDQFLDKYFLKAWSELSDEIRFLDCEIFAITTMKQKEANQYKIINDINIKIISDEGKYLSTKFELGTALTGIIVIANEETTKYIITDNDKPNNYPDPIDLWHHHHKGKHVENIRRGFPLTGHGWKNKNLRYYYRKPIIVFDQSIIVHRARIKNITPENNKTSIESPSSQKSLKSDRYKDNKLINRSFTLTLKLKKSIKHKSDKEVGFDNDSEPSENHEDTPSPISKTKKKLEIQEKSKWN